MLARVKTRITSRAMSCVVLKKDVRTDFDLVRHMPWSDQGDRLTRIIRHNRAAVRVRLSPRACVQAQGHGCLPSDHDVCMSGSVPSLFEAVILVKLMTSETRCIPIHKKRRVAVEVTATVEHTSSPSPAMSGSWCCVLIRILFFFIFSIAAIHIVDVSLVCEP